jgi:KaiC/GvpD/RAD55 family RecA-like ATPase
MSVSPSADADPRSWLGTNGEGGPVTVEGVTVYSVGDMLALPVRDYIVKGLFSPGEISVIVGPPKCGKSFFAMHLGYAVAQTRKVFSRRVKPVTVLYAAAEGEGGIGKRITALARKYGEALRFHVVAQPIDLLRSDVSQGHLRALIKIARMVDAGLIVIDTLNRAMAGGDENAPTDMGRFIANVSDLRHETGAHIAVVHHGNEASGGTKPRGHSSLKGAADAIIEVTKDDDGTRRAVIAAAKDDPDGTVMGFKLNVVELGEDEDGDPITTLLVEELTEAPQPSATLPKAAKVALNMLENLIAGHGTSLPPGADFPQGVRGCREDVWAAECETRRLSKCERERDRRRAFERAYEALLQAHRVAARDGWVWLSSRVQH